MNKITLALASAATLAVTAGTVYAQSPDRPERGADMTRAQVEQRTAAAFARMDANGDGVLDETDRAAMEAKRDERRAERQEARFDKLDADNNGAISRPEFEAGTEQARERFADRGKDGKRGDKRGRGGHRFGGGFGGPGMLGMADGNGDGAITQAEFTAAALERFDSADADRDGTVTAAERRSAMEAFREQRRAARTAQPS